MLKIDGLHVERGGQAVLRGLSFTVRPGELVTLIGANGSGKSTALLAIAGHIPIRAGSILWVDSRDSPQLFPRPGLLLQGGRVFASMSVRENLEVAGRGLGTEVVTERLAGVRASLPSIAGLWNRRAGVISGGERQVVSLAMTIVKRPTLLLLDEPLAGIDERNGRLIVELLAQIKCQWSPAIVLVEHRETLIAKIADNVIALKDGLAIQGRPNLSVTSAQSCIEVTS